MTNFFDLPLEIREMVYTEYFESSIKETIYGLEFHGYNRWRADLLFADPDTQIECAKVGIVFITFHLCCRLLTRHLLTPDCSESDQIRTA